MSIPSKLNVLRDNGLGYVEQRKQYLFVYNQVKIIFLFRTKADLMCRKYNIYVYNQRKMMVHFSSQENASLQERCITSQSTVSNKEYVPQ